LGRGGEEAEVIDKKPRWGARRVLFAVFLGCAVLAVVGGELQCNRHGYRFFFESWIACTELPFLIACLICRPNHFTDSWSED
jgi:hypothetical protein